MADIESLRRLIEENLEKKRENDPSIKAKAFKEATAALNIITNKKKSPNVDLITKLKKKYDKKEDFKNMCENPEVFNETLISLGINEK
jgi:3-deoxy-D-arabino-heptulosonate 7-phosphate (DAHP) synthase class II